MNPIIIPAIAAGFLLVASNGTPYPIINQIPNWVQSYERQQKTDYMNRRAVPVSRNNQQIIRACNKLKDPVMRRKCLSQIKK